MKEMEGSCELCSNQARIFCDSDQARLCWDCDEKVHCANFLVAKHCRNLLCHVCQTPTQWKASGPKLGPTISVCEKCIDDRNYTKPAREEEINQPQRRHQEEEQENDELCDGETESDGDYSTCSDSDGDSDFYDDDDWVEDEEDEGENQVVPWSCCSSTDPSSPKPPLASSSSSEDLAADGGATASSTLKRMRHTADLDSDDDDGCSSQINHNAAAMECGMPSPSSLRPLKKAKTSDLIQQIEGEISDPERRRLGIVTSLVRFQQNMVDGEHDASAIIQGISKMSKDS